MTQENEYTVAFPKPDNESRSDASATEPFQLREFDDASMDHSVTVRLGAVSRVEGTQKYVEPGRVLALDREVDQPVELFVGSHLIALGRLVVVQDKIAIEITQVASTEGSLRLIG